MKPSTTLRAAGKRTALVRFERAGVTIDANGCEVAGVWTLVCKAWCEPKFGTGDERRQSAALDSVQTVTFIGNQNSVLKTITNKDQIVWKNVRYDIHGASFYGLDQIEFTAKARLG